MTHVVTREQVIEAAKALGYDAAEQQLISIYASTEEVIIRRVDKAENGRIFVVEDITMFDPTREPKKRQETPGLAEGADHEQGTDQPQPDLRPDRPGRRLRPEGPGTGPAAPGT